MTLNQFFERLEEINGQAPTIKRSWYFDEIGQLRVADEYADDICPLAFVFGTYNGDYVDVGDGQG